MEGNLKTIELRDLSAGIQARSSDLAIEGEFAKLPLRSTSFNWSFGKRKGLTTRYGIMPIAGHNSSDMNEPVQSPSASLKYGGMQLPNLIYAEGSPTSNWAASDYYNRRKYIYGCVILQLPVGVDGELKPVTYWITSRQLDPAIYGGTNYVIDLVCSSAVMNSAFNPMAPVSKYESYVGGCAYISFGAGDSDTLTFKCVDRYHTSRITSLRKIESTTLPKYLNWTQMKVNIIDRTSECLMHVNAANYTVDPNTLPGGTPTTAPYTCDFYSHGMPYAFFGQKLSRKSMTFSAEWTTNVWQCKGFYSSKANDGDLKSADRTVSPGPDIDTGYATMTPTDTTTGYNLYGGLRFKDVTATYTFTTGAHVDTRWYFVKYSDQTAQHPATIVAMAVSGKPIIALYNQYVRERCHTVGAVTGSPSAWDRSNDYLQWINPTTNMYKPREYVTAATGGGLYTETFGGTVSQPISTCWYRAEAFTDAAAMTNVVANRGILEQYTIYEYAYSVYNSLTGKESNVGVPARTYTGATANGAIRVHTSGAQAQFASASGFANYRLPGLADIETSGAYMPFNFLIYRFYYRAVGGAEWVYAGEVSFAKVYFLQNFGDIFIGSGQGLGLPGGRPAGYLDYSDLPDDNYIDVKSFAKRLWWVSKSAVRFSSADSAFNYPVLNSITCDSDEFKGATVHYFPGQAQQAGRLVIWGSKFMYDVRESNVFRYMQVRVSPTADPQSVPVPDSNIVAVVKSSHTAFNGRCAVEAEGVLYYAGPTGIFRDDGVNFPQRISSPIEPDYFDAYDKTQTDEFFAYYNKKSREILFFYRPADLTIGFYTKAWVYHTEFAYYEDEIGYNPGPWSQYFYIGVIDWAQDLDLTGFLGGVAGFVTENTRGGGNRTLIGQREYGGSVSRPYFHDDFCECGDYRPGMEMMVKQITEIGSGIYELQFTNDCSVTVLSNVVTNTDFCFITGAGSYAGLPNFDGRFRITALDVANKKIRIQASAAGYGSYTLNYKNFFPVFFKHHAVTCALNTNDFAPYGVTNWCKFRYMHLLIQPVNINTGVNPPSATVSWNCNHNLSSSNALKTITLGKNATNETTTQIIFDMQSPGMQSEGQGIGIGIGYNQIGGRWTLFGLTLWHSPVEGKRNILMYQQ